MTIPLGEAVYFDETLQNPSTGAVSDGDSAPTFEVFEEATDTAVVSGTMTKRTSKTGDYRGTFTASTANGFEAGKWYSVVTSATVSSVSGKRVSMNFRATLAENVAGAPVADVGYVNGNAATPAGTVDANVVTWLGAAVTKDANDLPNVNVEDIGEVPAPINGSGQLEVVLVDGSLTTVKLGTFALAKTTNITGFNDLSAAQVNAEADTALADVTGLAAMATAYNSDGGFNIVAIDGTAPTTFLAGATIGTVTTYTGNTPQTGDNFARIGANGAGLTALATAAALTTAQGTLTKLDGMLVLDGAVYQYTANALELAPTGGSAPTAVQIRQEMDSNSTQLSGIKAKTDQLTFTTANKVDASAEVTGVDVDEQAIADSVIAGLAGQTLTYTNPVDTSDEDRLSIVAGDDYSSASSRIPTWVVTNYSGPALSSAGKLRFLPMAKYRKQGADAAAEVEISTTVSTASTTVTITAPLLTAAETIQLSTFPPLDRDTHMYQLVGVTSTGSNDVTLKLAEATVLRRIAPE